MTVNLYNSGGIFITSPTTASNGTYSFTGLVAGTYDVAETVPTNTYQTGPNALYYGVTTTPSAPASTNDNFSNYAACNMAGLSDISYTVITPSGVSHHRDRPPRQHRPGRHRHGQLHHRRRTPAPVQLSLVAYEAPTPVL